MKRTFLVLMILTLVSGLVLVACNPSTSTPATTATAAPLPKVVVMTTLAVGTTKYVQSSGFAEAVSKLSPMTVRLESTDTDLGRVTPLNTKESEFAYLTAVNAQMAARGDADYKNLGPTPLRRVWNGHPFLGGMFGRGDAGLKTVADLRGKRIPQSPSSVAWSQNNEAILAYGGLTLNDVKVVKVASVAAGMKGPLEGTLDASQGTLWNPSALELASGSHGIIWFDMPAENKEAWAKLQMVTPWARPIKGTAAGLKQGETITGAGYEQGVWSTPSVSNDIVYAFVKAMKEGYDIYKGMEPELKDWTWQRATNVEGLLDLPYHDGTVKFMKDAGVWTPAHETFQQAAVKAEKERLAKK